MLRGGGKPTTVINIDTAVEELYSETEDDLTPYNKAKLSTLQSSINKDKEYRFKFTKEECEYMNNALIMFAIAHDVNGKLGVLWEEAIASAKLIDENGNEIIADATDGGANKIRLYLDTDEMENEKTYTLVVVFSQDLENVYFATHYYIT